MFICFYCGKGVNFIVFPLSSLLIISDGTRQDGIIPTGKIRLFRERMIMSVVIKTRSRFLAFKGNFCFQSTKNNITLLIVNDCIWWKQFHFSHLQIVCELINFLLKFLELSSCLIEWMSSLQPVLTQALFGLLVNWLWNPGSYLNPTTSFSVFSVVIRHV